MRDIVSLLPTRKVTSIRNELLVHLYLKIFFLKDDMLCSSIGICLVPRRRQQNSSCQEWGRAAHCNFLPVAFGSWKTDIINSAQKLDDGVRMKASEGHSLAG